MSIMSDMNCPRCDVQMKVDGLENHSPGVTTTGIEIDVCNSCHGIWFDKGELAQAENVFELTGYEFRKIPGSKEQNVQMDCPKCNKNKMDKIENKRDKKVIMDVCPDCKGVWLDGGEIEAVQKENLFLILGRALKDIFSS
ncbi:MAG: zf-TFIIB domain-containing protein [bacterium]|nr:zf-TFIIB domain-containing protein [bacterium]